MLVRSFVHDLKARLLEDAPLIQVVLGPRQVGKTFGVREHLLPKIKGLYHFCTADDSLSGTSDWIDAQWQRALEMGKGTTLIIDEIQNIDNWAKRIKALWDLQKDPPSKRMLKVVLLGSSSLSLQKGLTESLAGRFEEIRASHWSFPEMQKAFKCDLDDYLIFGGYPGAWNFHKDYGRWFSYLKGSVIDTVIGKDILLQNRVQKPALFRQAFEILCHYPAQEVSYNKLLGQLQDRGNTDLVKYYIELYEGAFLFKTLSKYAIKGTVKKSSSPKILPLCPALSTLAFGQNATLTEKGRILEAAVGADLFRIPNCDLFYWRDGKYEVDYVLKIDRQIYGIEVKSARTEKTSGLMAFRARFPKIRTCMITRENYLQFTKEPVIFLERVSVG